jgi:hypothetical protein
MARSLSVKHEEAPATSSLLNFFLLLAFSWMALAAVAGSFAGQSDAPEQPVVVDAH